MKKLLCIDGNSILNRAFYGIRLLSNREGFPTNALYGMVNIISRQLEALKPDYAAMAYDLHAPTFRHKMYVEYKAGRHAMPDELRAQMPVSRTFASMLGIHVLDKEGYEADDILGTLAALAEADPEDCTAYLLTGDRDSLQLISPRVHVLLAGNTETTEMTETAFTEKYGVRPDQFVDVKALMGDASDHIPGVPGIGEKTALKLIAAYGSLDGVYEALPTAALTPSVRRKLEEGKDSAYLSQTLARIIRDVPLGLTLDDIATRPMDMQKARELFTKYEFSAFIKRFGLNTAETVPDAAPVAVPAEAPAGAGAIPPAVDASASDGTVSASANTVPASDDSAAVSSGTVAQVTLPIESLTCADLSALPTGQTVVALTDTTLSVRTDTRRADIPLTLTDGKLSATDAQAVTDFLHDPARRVVCHDAKTLYKALNAIGVTFFNASFDIMLAAYVLNAGQAGFDLDRLALAYLGHMPAAGEDTLPLIAAMVAPMTEQLTATGQTAVFTDIEMPLAAVLADMELIGFMIDRNAVSAYGQKLDTLADDLESRIYAMAGKPFNINSPKQLGEVLFDNLCLPSGKKTKTGYSTNAEVLEKLRHYHPIVDDILDYRQVTKLKSTYVEGLLKVADAEGRVHTTFKQTGTVTGRLSSAEPNLQNIPIRTELGREIRKFFIPSAPSRVLIDADYSQIELRLLADIAGDSAMRNAFLSGFDIHTDTASRIFGVSKENVTIEMRKKAKAINFGLMYGMGEFSLSEDLRVSRAEAKSYMDSYMNSYPDIERYLDRIVREAYEHGYVTTKYGRRRLIPELAETNKMRKRFGERVAMNSPIQGTAADIIKLAMIRVHDRLAASGLDARMILQVHDELILDASRDCAEAAMALLKEEMEKAAQLSVPLEAEAHIGASWFEAH